MKVVLIKKTDKVSFLYKWWQIILAKAKLLLKKYFTKKKYLTRIHAIQQYNISIIMNYVPI